MKGKKIFYWDRLLSMLTCLLLVATIALQRSGRIAGREAGELLQKSSTVDVTADTIQIASDGTIVVYTRELSKKVIGFGGPTPLQIYIKNNRIDHIETEPNSETPDFFSHATQGILPLYEGKTIDEALQLQVDAVSGATYSSTALIENMRLGLSYAQAYISHNPVVATPATPAPSPLGLWALIAGCAVVVLGALLPLIVKQNKVYRIIQLLLNVAVLGCWCGTFISYSLLANFMANGVNLAASAIGVLMLAVVVLYPLFGRSRHYCLWVCPLGSAQELLWTISPLKRKMGQLTAGVLSLMRWIVWSVLMVLMLTGVWMEWMDYELFSIFLFGQASWVVIVLAAVFAILSLLTSRPYCRYLCPTGCLMQAAENKTMKSGM